MSDILLLTTDTPPPGKTIAKVIGMVEGHGGQRPDENQEEYIYSNIVTIAYDIAKSHLLAAAKEAGANALIGVRVSTTNAVGNHFIVTTTLIGTAVVLKDEA